MSVSLSAHFTDLDDDVDNDDDEGVGDVKKKPGLAGPDCPGSPSEPGPGRRSAWTG